MSFVRDVSLALRGVRRAGPLHLTLFVTGRCQLRCRHCFHHAGVAAARPGPSVAEVERLAASMEAFGPLMWVSFGGGEPFLRADIAELAACFGRRGLRHLAIPTNGLEPRTVERARAILAAAPDTELLVSVSIDGPPDVHDEVRARQGAHAGAVAGARALLALAADEPRLSVGLITTVTRANEDTLAAHLAALCGDLRPHRLTVNLARSDALDRDLLRVDVERYEEVVRVKQQLEASGVVRGVAFRGANVLRRRDELLHRHIANVARTAGDLGRAHLPCTAGALSLVVFEDGTVAPCEVRPERLGQLADFDWDLARLWREAAAQDLRARIVRERCVCTFECAQGDNVLFHPRHWASFARAALAPAGPR
ncbi:MAG: radical SAM protein [Planctomycetota bacterium]